MNNVIQLYQQMLNCSAKNGKLTLREIFIMFYLRNIKVTLINLLIKVSKKQKNGVNKIYSCVEISTRDKRTVKENMKHLVFISEQMEKDMKASLLMDYIMDLVFIIGHKE